MSKSEDFMSSPGLGGRTQVLCKSPLEIEFFKKWHMLVYAFQSIEVRNTLLFVGNFLVFLMLS